MSGPGLYIDPILALSRQQAAPQPAAQGAPTLDPVAALAQQHAEIPMDTAVRNNSAPKYGFAVDAAHQITGGLIDKLAAAAGATFPKIGPNVVAPDPTWTGRYQKTLQNIRGGLTEFEHTNPEQAYAAKAIGVVGPMLVGAGEASPLVNALKGSAFGGAYGFGGTNDQSLGDDLAATGEGALLGLGSAGAGHAIGSTIGSGVGRAVDAVTGNTQTRPQRLAAAMLQDRMNQQGVTAPDLIAQLSGADRPVTMMDVGGENAPLQRLGRSMVTLPGQQSQEITVFLNNRHEGQRGRVLGDISQLAPNTDTYGTGADLRQTRFEDSDPLYKQAFDNPIVPSEHLDYLQSSPDIKKGMAGGLRIQQRKAFANNVPFDPAAYGVTGFNEAGDPIIGPNPSWRTWHAAREGLDDMIYSQADPTTRILPETKDIGSLQDLRRGLNKTLTTLNPDLSAADAAWSTPSQNLEAMQRGQKFMNADPEQITSALGRLPPEGQEHYQVGAGRAMRDVANDTSDNRNIPLRLNNDQTARDQVSAAFGDQPGQEFTNRMNLERQLAQTRQFVTGNSSTANKAADVAAANEPSVLHQILSDVVKGGLTGGLHGAVALPAINLANRSGNRFISNLLNNEPRNLELARVLTAHGPNAGQNITDLLGPAQNRARIISGSRAVGGALGRGAGSLLIPALMSPTANSAGQ